MIIRTLLAALLSAGCLVGQEAESLLPAQPLPIPFPRAPVLDPLLTPPELVPIMRKATMREWSLRSKLQGILDVIFRPESDGGLGITYDNSHTRTISEVLQDRKANCLSLTALYVASCRLAGIPAQYAEPWNLNHWRREGQLIRMERHVVALVPMFPQEDLVADFLPRLRQHQGIYMVKVLQVERLRALYYSNRAVELLMEGLKPEALEQADLAVKSDPTSNVAWNIRGVVLKSTGENARAEADYLKALSLEPKDTAAIGNMEALLRASNRDEEALKYRQLGLELRKKDPYFQAFLAEEAMEAEQWEAASKLVATAIKLLPYEPDFYLIKARLDLRNGKSAEALSDLELARRWALPAERKRYDTKIALLNKG